MKSPKILVADIETFPMEAYVWSSWDQNIPFPMLKTDWSILSWAAKWHGEKRVFYEDVRKQKNIRDDKAILKGIWELLNAADVVIWQNGKSFDYKKLNARFLLNGMKPPSPYKQIDTRQLAKKYFALTHNSLEYMSEKINKKYRKSKHKQFHGFDLWKACMEGQSKAWREMEFYNKADVLSTEELYDNLQAWGTGVDFNVYRGGTEIKCNCGSGKLTREGYSHTKAGKFQRWKCTNCGAWTSDRGKSNNLLSGEKQKALKGNK